MDHEEGLSPESKSLPVNETCGLSPEQTLESKTSEEINDEETTQKDHSPEKGPTLLFPEAPPESQLGYKLISIENVQDSSVDSTEKPSGTDLATIATSTSLGVANETAALEKSEEHDQNESKKRERLADPTIFDWDSEESVQTPEKRPRHDEGKTDERRPRNGETTVASRSMKVGFGSGAESQKKSPTPTIKLSSKVATLSPGIFDDAESPTNSPTPTIEMSSEVATLSPGIFDDADEDNTFDLEQYRRSVSRERTFIRPDLISAILGSRQKPKIVSTPVLASSGTATVGGQTLQVPVLVSSGVAKVDGQTPEEPSRKKQLRKVLVTKKEKEAATATLEGRIDLLRILPRDDCNFLAKEMWIFTLQQLEFILDDNKTASKLGARDGLVTRLARCELSLKLKPLGGKFEGDVGQGREDCSEKMDDLKSNGEGHSSIPRETHPLTPQNDESPALENSRELYPEIDGVSKRRVSSSDMNEFESESTVVVSCEKSHPTDAFSNLKYSSTKDDFDSAPPTSPTDFEAGTAEASGDDSKESIDARKAAELKVAFWMKSITKWKQEETVSRDADQFPLDGPLSILFPAGTLQFIKSANIKTAHQFMCLKKTETGLVVEMFQNWRNKCGLPTIGMLSLAKHLLGINARLEMAIKSVPNADADKISWMSGGMVVVTGLAKDFIIDHCKIHCASQFVEMRTKFLADKLSDWRNNQGLPTLKGSGKVAMISAWKAGLRDEIEIESSRGKIVPEEDILTELEEEIDEPEQKKRKLDNGDLKPKKTSKYAESQSKQSLQYSTPIALNALDSDKFFATLFPEQEKRRMLNSIKIETARQYLDADKGQNSMLLKAVIDMKSKNSDDKVQPSSCIRLLYEWNARVKNKLDELESGTVHFENSDNLLPDDSLKNHNPKTPLPRKTASDDPFDALSTTSKDFLASMNISTAEQFLLARTKDIAIAFVNWRDEMKLAPLKGLGAVASVSGWKKLVRNKAFAVGDETLAQLNQASNMKVVGDTALKSTEKKKEKKSDLGAVDGLPRQDRSMRTTSGGMSRNQFSAFSVQKNIVFHFELDARQGPKVDRVYLTYLGNDSASSVAECASIEPSNDASKIKEGSISTLVDLGKVSAPMHGRRPYSSVTYGSIELGNRGVQPRVEDQEAAVVALSDSIKLFVMHPLTASYRPDDSSNGIEMLPSEVESKQSHDKSPIFPGSKEHRPLDGSSIKESEKMERRPPDGSYNMFETATNGGKKYYLYLAEPIERGQSVELCFFPGITFSAEWMQSADDSRARNWIRDRLEALPLKELREMQVFLTDEIANPIFRQLEDIAVSHGLVSSADSTPFALGLVLARRRVHWIASLVKRQLQHNSNLDVPRSLRNSFDTLHWNKDLLSKLRIDQASTSFELAKVTEEVEQEINNSFHYEGCNGFAGTRDCWCPLAERLFRRIVHLFAELSVSFDELSSKDEDDFTEKVCHAVSQAIEDLKRYASIDENTALEDLVLTFAEGFSHASNALPSVREVIVSSFAQQDVDAMNLVDEMEVELPPMTKYQVVATRASSSDVKTTRLLNLFEVSRRRMTVDLLWYLERQVFPVMQCALRCGKTSFLLPVTRENKILDQIESKVLQNAQIAMADPNIALFALESTTTDSEPVKQILLPKNLHISNSKSNYQPHSAPFFLGFVWPILRASGWKLSAGDNLSDVVYFPPDSGSKRAKTGIMKKEIMRETTQLARDTASVGLGYIPKLTKRLIIRCLQQGQDDHTEMQETDTDFSASPKGSCSTSISSALTAFESYLEESLRSDDKDRECFLRQKARDIVKVISALAEEVAPLALFDEERYDKDEGDKWSDVLGCEHLMRILILLPSILKEANLPIREHDQTVHIVRELIDFLARNHVELFASSFHLPKEEYEDECSVLSNVAIRIKKAFPPNGNGIEATNGNQVDDESNTEVLNEGDRCNLTDFVAGVMSQVVIFRAKQEDMNRKGRRIPLGQPGLVCRHCLGQNGEGKYFFGSIESMTTASTVIEKHLLRCPHVPDSARLEIVASRARHPDQRKGLQPGVQGAFFATLFDRLRSMRVSDDPEVDESNIVFVTKPASESFRYSPHTVLGAPLTSSSNASTSEMSDGFKNILDVMDFVQSTEPWKSMDSLVEMVEKYYNCLEYGGKIYNTATMPSHFSSEWLYAKVVPRK